MLKDDALLQLLQADNWGALKQTDPLLHFDRKILQQLPQAAVQEGCTTHTIVQNTSSSFNTPSTLCYSSSTVALNAKPANRPLLDAASEQQCCMPEADTLTWLQTHNLNSVDTCDALELSEPQFMSQYMVPNKPVLIKGGMQHWRAVHSWVQPDGRPNIGALLEAAGRDAVVTVTDTSQQQEGCGPCKETTLGQFADWWESRTQHVADVSGSERSHLQQQASNALPSSTNSTQLDPTSHWYLKDWHFVTACPGYNAYELPPYFASDWLNEHYDWLGATQVNSITSSHESLQPRQQAGANPCQHIGNSQHTECKGEASSGPSAHERVDDILTNQQQLRCSDYRFVYVGPAGSWTPLHSDVLRSFSWSANVAGRKLWLLLPPKFTHLVYDVSMSHAAAEFGHPCVSHLPPGCVAPIQQPLSDDPQLAARFPYLAVARQHLYGVVQEAGEMLFVPSGWHHTVYNLTDTISINHNWLNAHNIQWCWQLVLTTHQRAAQSIQDCRSLCVTQLEWWQLVQRMLAADCGLNLQGLARLCAGVIGRRLTKMLHGFTGRTEQLQTHLDAKRACSVLSSICEMIDKDYDLTVEASAYLSPAAAAQHLKVLDNDGFDFEKTAFHIGEVESPLHFVLLARDMIARCSAVLAQLPCVGC